MGKQDRKVTIELLLSNAEMLSLGSLMGKKSSFILHVRFKIQMLPVGGLNKC